MTSNGFTIADQNDCGMLDVVGFDTTVPAVIAGWFANSEQFKDARNSAGGGESLRPIV